MTSDGSCHGSFGELLQGVLPGGKKFLVNLPIKTSSRAALELLPPIYDPAKEEAILASYGRWPKSRKIVRNILADHRMRDDFLLTIDSDLPVGKGLSSSTADMVASVLALEKAMGTQFAPEYVSRLVTEIEPNDGLHYPGIVAYHHTTGELIEQCDYVPPWRILGIDVGGAVDTVRFNGDTPAFTEADMYRYEVLLANVRHLLAAGSNQGGLAAIATESTWMWLGHYPKPHFNDVVELYLDTEGLGIINTHSGTYLGILYPPERDINEVWRWAKEKLPDCHIGTFETVSSLSVVGG